MKASGDAISVESKLNIQKDALIRRIYDNEASLYEEIQEGVCFPKNAEDLQALVRKSAREGFPITARAAGTSLAGQTTGSGVIADVSRYMTNIIKINAEERYADVQPGVIRDSLNRQAAHFGLHFAPDTSTTNRCMLGGMIGNNSCGSYSLKFGTTREHIIHIDAILSDGSHARFEPLNPDQLVEKMRLDSLEGEIYRKIIPLLKKNAEAIRRHFPHPEVKRRNTGYALDRLCEMEPVTPGGRTFNLAELLCGSEGTLALTASARVKLTPTDPHRCLLIPHFRSLDDAMKATVEAVKHSPAAVELIDDIILNATKNNLEQQKNRFFIDDDPACLLLIEFSGNDPAELEKRASELRRKLTADHAAYAAPFFAQEDQIGKVWELRKAGLGLLMGLSSDSKSPTFVEDTSVRVQDLPEYIREFRGILKKHEVSCVFYAHASVGELHLRPVIDLNSEAGIRKMKAIAEEVADLVASYRGSLSGEHGDGRARSPYISRVIGEEMMPHLEEVKRIFDSENRFNPGKITAPKPIDDQLRYYPGKPEVKAKTVFNWREERRFADALDRCNGAGVCRKRAESGGTMCPSYMATLDEKDSTRGRANVFRQVFRSGKDGFDNPELHEALKLCLSCKACKSECPANVDMAKMKAEFMQGWLDRNGFSFADRFWSNPFPWLKLGAKFPGISNYMSRLPAVKFLMETFAGVHPSRNLPAFAETTFEEWWQENEKSTAPSSSEKKLPDVLLLVDPFTNLHQPGQAISAWKALKKLGVPLRKLLIAHTGRTMISGGALRQAQDHLTDLLRMLKQRTGKQTMIVGLEPSELLTLRDELTDLCHEEDLEAAQDISSRTLLFEEFVHRFVTPEDVSPSRKNRPRKVAIHGHCYVKALTGTGALQSALELFGYEVTELKTGCCGMAGSFGYRKETYDVSQKIGGLTLFPALKNLDKETIVCTHGFSCHHQIVDKTGLEVRHPAEMIGDII